VTTDISLPIVVVVVVLVVETTSASLPKSEQKDKTRKTFFFKFEAQLPYRPCR
jgi:hypothetical protein